MKNHKISNWIDNKIAEQGAKTFFDNINNLWEDYAYDIRNMVLDEIYGYIKPSKIDTIEDLAKLLNGNSYDNELDNRNNIDVEKICKENKWVICFPYSDDCIEFKGYIDDELGAWDGGYYKFYKKGDFYLVDEYEETYKKVKSDTVIGSNESDCDIKVIWEDVEFDKDTNKKYIWNYIVKNQNLPHAYFDIIDEDTDVDEVWAKCCVIDCSSIL